MLKFSRKIRMNWLSDFSKVLILKTAKKKAFTEQRFRRQILNSDFCIFWLVNFFIFLVVVYIFFMSTYIAVFDFNFNLFRCSRKCKTKLQHIARHSSFIDQEFNQKNSVRQ